VYKHLSLYKFDLKVENSFTYTYRTSDFMPSFLCMKTMGHHPKNGFYESCITSIVAFYDIHVRRERCYSFILSRTPHIALIHEIDCDQTAMGLPPVTSAVSSWLRNFFLDSEEYLRYPFVDKAWYVCINSTIAKHRNANANTILNDNLLYTKISKKAI
jgi:hypothetical protein